MRMIPAIGYLECAISPGMFSNEYAVTVVTSGTQLLSPAEAITVKKNPVDGTPGIGFLRVRVLEVTGDQALVAFPQEAFTSKSRLLVSRGAIQTRP